METGFARSGLLLIENDPVFGALVRAVATSRGVPLRVCESLTDLGSVGRLAEYDVVILDYDLNGMNGVEISEYVSAFFRDKPVVLISGSAEHDLNVNEWPASVRRFVPKASGAGAILDAALREAGVTSGRPAEFHS